MIIIIIIMVNKIIILVIISMQEGNPLEMVKLPNRIACGCQVSEFFLH